MSTAEQLAALAAPFSPTAISWRVGSMNKDKTKAMALAYVDAVRHYNILTKSQIAGLRKADPVEIEMGKVVEWGVGGN